MSGLLHDLIELPSEGVVHPIKRFNLGKKWVLCDGFLTLPTLGINGWGEE